nr:MAG TPA: hypothetical protein [Caudoviricetes sp.]
MQDYLASHVGWLATPYMSTNSLMEKHYIGCRYFCSNQNLWQS